MSGRIRAKGGVSNHVYFVPDTVWRRGVWGTAQPRKIHENFIFANDFNMTVEKSKLKGFINTFSAKIQSKRKPAIN